MRHRDIFLAALDLPAAERTAYLDRACADDAELRRLVEELLLSNDEAGSFLEHPAVTDETRTVGERAAPSEPTPATDGGAAPADDLSFLAPSPTPGSLGRLGHYDVREVVGQGGMGLVLRAFDEKLHRIVAVKVLAPVLAASGTARQRFSREARAAAAVSHDHVVAIYAVEDDGPIAYLVMQMIDGLSLEEKVRQKGPLALKEVLRIGLQTAAGLAAAHKQGLVHRDIKPGNILLENGVERVKITDFGLARAVDDASVTQSGVIAGTPLYMSPEQARGEMVDHRSDLFSLGSVLYTLCTGRPAFRAGNTMAVLRRVCEEEPRPIHEVNAEVPDWLGAIVARLMAKDPAERFQSAAEVADLLGRHLAHLQQPGLAARPETVAVPRRRKTRRVPVLATAVAGVLIAVGAGLAYFFWHQAGPDGLSVIPEQPKPFVPQPPLTPDELAKLPSPLDGRKRDDIRPDLLALAGGGDSALAPPELVAVLGDGRFVLPGEGLTSWMAPSPDGKLLAVPRGSNVVLFDAGTGAVVRTLAGRGERAYGAAFSPDGTRLASGTLGGGGAITVWDVPTGQVVHVLKGHTGDVWRTAFSGDGKRLVSGSSDKTAKVWDAEKGVELFTLTGHQDAVYAVTFSPDGRSVLTGSRDGSVKVWDARTGQESKTLPVNGDNVWSLVYSPDGKILAGGCWRGWKLWDAKTFEEVRSGSGTAAWLAFSADSRVLLTGRHGNDDGATHAVTRWDVASGDKLGTLSLKSAGGWAFYALSPDAKTLFAMSGDPPDLFVREYDAETGRELFPHQGHTMQRVWSAAFSPDGKLLASGGDGGTICLWDLAGWKPGEPLPPVRKLTGHTLAVWSVAFSPDGKLLASGSYDGTFIVWEVATARRVHTLSAPPNWPSVVALNPDGKTLATGQEDGTVRRWDVASGDAREPLRWHNGPVVAVAFSPDGRYLASKGRTDQTVCLADAATGQLLHKFRNPTPGKGQSDEGLVFSPDSKALAFGGGTEVRVCDVETKAETTLRGHTDWVHGVAFHPAGRFLASASDDHTVRLWDLSSPGRVLTLGPGPFGHMAREVAFDPTGRYLATSNWNATVTIFRTPEPPKPYDPGSPAKLPDPKELAAKAAPADALKRDDIHPGQHKALPPEVVAVLGGPAFALPEGDASWMAVSADGKMLAVPCGDKVVVFDAHSGKRLHTLFGHTGRAYCAAFSPDGKRLASGNWDAKDHTIRTWSTETGEAGIGRSAHSGNINAVAYSPEGKSFVSASSDGTAYLWGEVKDRKDLILKGHQGPIFGAAFSPDGKRVATASEDKTVRVWDAATGKEIKTLEGNGQGFMNVAFSPDGKLLASGTDEKWMLWDAETLKEVRTVAGPAGWLAFAPDGKSLLAATHNNSGTPDAPHVVNRWSVEGKELASFELKGKGGWAAYALSPDGTTLFEVTIHTDDSTLRTYDAATGAEGPTGRPGRLIVAAISSDGKHLASAGEDSLINLWGLATGELERTLRGHAGKVRGVAFSPDGKRLASQGEDGTLRLWDPAGGKELAVLERGKADGWGLAFSPDGRRLASASQSDGGLRLWDVSAGKLVRVFRGHHLANRLAFSPDSRLLACGDDDSTIRVWDVASGWQIRGLRIPGRFASSAGFSPDGRLLAAGSFDGTVKLWDVATGEEVGDPWKLAGPLDGIGFGPDGRLLAASSYDGTIRLRDLTARPPRERTIRLPAGCENLTFTPEGRYLAVPCHDGSVYVLRLAERGKVFEAVAP